MNRGIDLSTGNYIARMDSDDIAVPHRIEQQVEFMRRNKNVDLCASTIIIIDKSGKKGGTWDLDQRTLRHNQIRRSMAVENCIAHPTVLAKAQIFKENKYDTAQVNMEDYGLWLRLISKGYRFEKIGEPLLLYRVHENSITSTTLKDKNFFFRHARLKRRFAWTELRSGRWNSFVFAVLASVLVDAAKGTVKLLKNR